MNAIYQNEVFSTFHSRYSLSLIKNYQVINFGYSSIQLGGKSKGYKKNINFAYNIASFYNNLAYQIHDIS